MCSSMQPVSRLAYVCVITFTWALSHANCAYRSISDEKTDLVCPLMYLLTTLDYISLVELLNRLDAIKKEEAQQAATLIRDLQNASSLLDACNDVNSEIHHW